MDVKSFVSATLRQVLEGVQDAQSFALEVGAAVNPLLSSAGSVPLPVSETGQTVYSVDFDIAVTTESVASKEGGAGIKVASFVDFGAKGSSQDRAQSVSRVRFTVPICMPPDKASETVREATKRRTAETMKNFNARTRDSI